MIIIEITPQPNWILRIVSEDDRVGVFDVKPYLNDEAFKELNEYSEFVKVTNGGYFIEWSCGADLSADTIEAKWSLVGNEPVKNTPLIK